jgi:HAD superfamily hydrolase (TIGR01490 family)
MNLDDTKVQSCRQRIAVFDFDGTLTMRDSFLAFLSWRRSKLRFFVDYVLMFPLLLLYVARLVPNSTHKMALFRRRFAGVSVARYRELGAEFARWKLPSLLRQEALTTLRQHHVLGHRVLIITASFPEWIAPWALQEGVDEVIASKAEVREGYLTGDMDGFNCYGSEKARRLLASLPERDSYELFCYGDSLGGDREILAIADHPFYRRFS